MHLCRRFQEELHKEPNTLEALKHVLNTVATIRSEGMTMELKYSDLEERFRTRVMYAQPQELDQANEQLVHAQQVRLLWAALADEADDVDWRLEDTKKLFSETTRQQVSEFQEYTSQLWERFKTTGPGVPTIELNVGLELLHQFQVRTGFAAFVSDMLA
eukprot:1158274-Pelagomonas_calceolata.AAC.20